MGRGCWFGSEVGARQLRRGLLAIAEEFEVLADTVAGPVSSSAAADHRAGLQGVQQPFSTRVGREILRSVQWQGRETPPEQ